MRLSSALRNSSSNREYPTMVLSPMNAANSSKNPSMVGAPDTASSSIPVSSLICDGMAQHGLIKVVSLSTTSSPAALMAPISMIWSLSGSNPVVSKSSTQYSVSPPSSVWYSRFRAGNDRYFCLTSSLARRNRSSGKVPHFHLYHRFNRSGIRRGSSPSELLLESALRADLRAAETPDARLVVAVEQVVVRQRIDRARFQALPAAVADPLLDHQVAGAGPFRLHDSLAAREPRPRVAQGVPDSQRDSGDEELVQLRGAWQLTPCRYRRHRFSQHLEAVHGAQAPVRGQLDVFDVLRVASHYPDARRIGLHDIIGRDYDIHLDRLAVGRAASAFHPDDAVQNHQVALDDGVEVDDALVQSLQVDDVLLLAHHHSLEVLESEGDHGLQVGLHHGHIDEPVAGQHVEGHDGILDGLPARQLDLARLRAVDVYEREAVLLLEIGVAGLLEDTVRLERVDRALRDGHGRPTLGYHPAYLGDHLRVGDGARGVVFSAAHVGLHDDLLAGLHEALHAPQQADRLADVSGFVGVDYRYGHGITPFDTWDHTPDSKWLLLNIATCLRPVGSVYRSGGVTTIFSTGCLTPDLSLGSGRPMATSATSSRSSETSRAASTSSCLASISPSQQAPRPMSCAARRRFSMAAPIASRSLVLSYISSWSRNTAMRAAAPATTPRYLVIFEISTTSARSTTFMNRQG